MSKSNGLSKYFRVIIFLAATAVVIYFITQNISAFKSVLLVALGFGAVIMIHEFGHFIVAKLSNIKVEAFSIGFSPVLVGIQKTENGVRFRILPQLLPKDKEDDSGDGLLTFTIGKKCKPSETEYRIGLIPFGGFVALKGQSDTGAVENDDDPRSFVNKPVITRIGVIAAGVIFNAISAVIIFMIVFLIGVKLPPAVVGSVRPDSPAARAGIRAGDEFIEINGETFLDFTSMPLAAALSTKDEPVMMKVRHEDGSVEQIEIVAEKPKDDVGLRIFGIQQAHTLTVASVSDPNILMKTMGLLPGDVITAVNGIAVNSGHKFDEAIANALSPAVTLTANRTDPETGVAKQITSELDMDLVTTNDNFQTGYELAHIYSIVPRLKLFEVQKRVENLQAGDIILAAGDIANPTFKELRKITTEHKNKELPIVVQRATDNGSYKKLTFNVTPVEKSNSERVEIGIALIFDTDNPVVAKTILSEDGPEPLAIPSGAVITAVDGVEVSSFYDIINIIDKNAGQRITIDWRLDEQRAGDVVLDIPKDKDFITAQSILVQNLPFELVKRIYKADGPFVAIKMGLKRTYLFIAQTYVTLKRLASRDVSPKSLVGPIGIVTMSYNIVAKQPITYYIYFLGLISSCIAVMNLLPLPIVDGGVIVLLLIEKVKGSPISVKVQEVISYAGLALIASLFLYLTYNDILRIIFGW